MEIIDDIDKAILMCDKHKNCLSVLEITDSINDVNTSIDKIMPDELCNLIHHIIGQLLEDGMKNLTIKILDILKVKPLNYEFYTKLENTLKDIKKQLETPSK